MTSSSKSTSQGLAGVSQLCAPLLPRVSTTSGTHIHMDWQRRNSGERSRGAWWLLKINFKRTKTRRGNGREKPPGKGSEKDNRGWKKAAGPFTQSPFCFFLPLLHPSTAKMRIYTLKWVISIRNISNLVKTSKFRVQLRHFHTSVCSNSIVIQFVFNS